MQRRLTGFSAKGYIGKDSKNLNMSAVAVSHSNELRTLRRLGLTVQEARVYLALAKSRQSSVKELSRSANIDRGECYRILAKLSEKRLVSKLIASPIQYAVDSFDEGIASLLEWKRKEMDALEGSTVKLLRKVRDIEARAEFDLIPEETTRFMPGGPASLGFLAKKFSRNAKSICILSDLHRCEFIEQSQASHGQKMEWRPGMSARFLVSDPKRDLDLKRLPITNKLLEKPRFSLRTTSANIAAPIGIQDDRAVEIIISKQGRPDKESILVSTNERLIRLAQAYFDNLWDHARKVKSPPK